MQHLSIHPPFLPLIQFLVSGGKVVVGTIHTRNYTYGQFRIAN